MASQEEWNERLGAAEAPPWVMTERPNRSRILLEVYTEDHEAALFLVGRFGGLIRLVRDEEWLYPAQAAPLWIGQKLEIVHSTISKRSKVPTLHIPHGMAFGSGDHGTTGMLLRALTRHEDWPATRVLDLGTGSGVLALTARLLGARKIVATDFDAEAVRIARENEERNFSTMTIRWQCADVKKLKVRVGFDLVTANLFSEILCEAAPQIAASVASGGQLWLSGILRSQKEQVMASYRRQKLKLEREVSRGKWVLLQWSKPKK
jgi:ribosomal protein L11 methyltransferase